MAFEDGENDNALLTDARHDPVRSEEHLANVIASLLRDDATGHGQARGRLGLRDEEATGDAGLERRASANVDAGSVTHPCRPPPRDVAWFVTTFSPSIAR